MGFFNKILIRLMFNFLIRVASNRAMNFVKVLKSFNGDFALPF